MEVRAGKEAIRRKVVSKFRKTKRVCLLSRTLISKLLSIT